MLLTAGGAESGDSEGSGEDEGDGVDVVYRLTNFLVDVGLSSRCFLEPTKK